MKPDPYDADIGSAVVTGMLVDVWPFKDLPDTNRYGYGQDYRVYSYQLITPVRDTLWTHLHELAVKGHLPLYHLTTLEPLSEQERDSILNFSLLTQLGDSTYWQLYPGLYASPRVCLYWYYDLTEKKLKVQVHSMALVREDYDDQGNYRGTLTLAYIMKPGAIKPPGKKKQKKTADRAWNVLVSIEMAERYFRTDQLIKQMHDMSMPQTIFDEFEKGHLKATDAVSGEMVYPDELFTRYAKYDTILYTEMSSVGVTLTESNKAVLSYPNADHVSQGLLTELNFYWDNETSTLSVDLLRYAPLFQVFWSTERKSYSPYDQFTYLGNWLYFWIENE